MDSLLSEHTSDRVYIADTRLFDTDDRPSMMAKEALVGVANQVSRTPVPITFEGMTVCEFTKDVVLQAEDGQYELRGTPTLFQPPSSTRPRRASPSWATTSARRKS